MKSLPLKLWMPLLILTIAMVTSVDASPTAKISIYPLNQTLPVEAVGTEIVVYMTVTEVNLLRSWQAGLTWNASLLECTDVKVGNWTKGQPASVAPIISIPDNVLGKLDPCVHGLDAGYHVNYTAGEIGTLLELTFLVKNAPGYSNLHIGPDPVDQNVFLLDPDNLPIMDRTTIDGSVTVIPEFPAALIMPLFIIATLAVAILGKIIWSTKRKETAIAK